MRSALYRLLPLVGLGAAMPALGAEISLYERDGFAGECLTLGPGDTPTIPHGFGNRISSARRINSCFPLNQNPTWRR